MPVLHPRSPPPILLLFFVGPVSLTAQERGEPAGPPPDDVVEESEVEVTRPRGPWWTLWSRRTPHDRLIAGMTTMHVYQIDEGLRNNQAVGVVYVGFVGATFITTHGPRGFVLAAERSWREGRWGPVRTMVGFRAGLIYGYDERLFELARHTPILPYGQPVLLLQGGPLTVDLTYTWVVMSLTFGIRMW